MLHTLRRFLFRALDAQPRTKRTKRPSLRLETLEGRALPAVTISTIAGTGPSDFRGDRGPAVRAMLAQPSGITVDNKGNIYFIDDYNERVRKITPNGIITTIAGNGMVGDFGDGGLATRASFQFGSGAGVAVDSKGNVYVACPTKHRVRVIRTNGTIHHFAGKGYGEDGGPASEADLDSPYAVAVDSKDNVYIADSGKNNIRKVTPNGIISTIAGNGTRGFGGDGGLATNAMLNMPSDVAVDGKGNVYVLDSFNNRVRKVTPAGIITTLAGNGVAGFLGDNGRATQARFNFARQGGLTVDGAGNVFVADTGNNRVRQVLTNGIIRTVAGIGTRGFGGDGGLAVRAKLWNPTGVDVDARGNLLISDTFNNRIRKVLGVGAPTVVAPRNANLGNSVQVVAAKTAGSTAVPPLDVRANAGTPADYFTSTTTAARHELPSVENLPVATERVAESWDAVSLAVAAWATGW